MAKLLSYPLSLIFFMGFGLVLLIFHPIQWVCLHLFGYGAHKKSVDTFNWLLLRCTNLLGVRYLFENKNDIPTDKPLIIVANHQSLYDIPPIIWYMRKHHPKFVSKEELGKGIPSVSFNLKYGGAALIDRKDPEQAMEAIGNLGRYIEEHNRSAVIFPEGTRSRDGKPRPFKASGLKTLLKSAPSALIVPITINNSWKMLRYGKFPMGLGAYIQFKVHPPIENKGNPDELLKQVEHQITKNIV